jgi:Ca2+-binding RTX toxin-like protein
VIARIPTRRRRQSSPRIQIEWLESRLLMDATPTNSLPTISLSSTEATAYVPFNPTVTLGDPDGDPVSWAPFGWTRVGDTSLILGYAYEANGDLRLIGTPSNANAGDNTYSVSLTDGKDTVTRTFTVHVAAVPDSPTVFITTPTTAATVGKQYRYDYELSDPDGRGENMNIHVVGALPAWLHLTDDGYKASLLGTPSAPGDYTVTLSVDNETVTQSITIHVAPNTPPAFTSAAPASATVGSLYTYNVTVTDPDGNRLTISAPSGMPSWLALADHHNGTATLSGTPGAADVGAMSLVLRVSDTVTHVDQSSSITVAAAAQTTPVDPPIELPANHPPLLVNAPTSALSADALKPFAYIFTASDEDGDALAITMENAPAWLKLVQNGGNSAMVSGTPDITLMGTTPTFDLVISDGRETVRTAVQVTVPIFRYRLDNAGTLTVVGSNIADVLAIAQTADDDMLRLTYNGSVQHFAQASVNAIEVYGQDGNDLVCISAGNIPAYVLGGAGNDTLSGGDEVDNFVGGGGKDLLCGGLGNDRLNGHNGNDTLLGNDGDDRLYGGDGNDILVGGNGKDRCYGEAGDDFFASRGDRKIDLLYGGTGVNQAAYDASLDHLADITLL